MKKIEKTRREASATLQKKREVRVRFHGTLKLITE